MSNLDFLKEYMGDINDSAFQDLIANIIMREPQDREEYYKKVNMLEMLYLDNLEIDCNMIKRFFLSTYKNTGAFHYQIKIAIEFYQENP